MLVAQSSSAQEITMPKRNIAEVIYRAARRYDIDAQDLVKIAFLESTFKVNAKRFNKNGTIDYGMFQISSIHWTTTCKEYDISKPQGNAYCAAKLISIAKEYKDTDKHWLGRYHSKTPSHKRSYSRALTNLKIVEKN
jgi:hypothetical protein